MDVEKAIKIIANILLEDHGYAYRPPCSGDFKMPECTACIKCQECYSKDLACKMVSQLLEVIDEG